MLNITMFLLGIVSIYFITELPDVFPYFSLPVLFLLWLLIPAARWVSSFFLGVFWMSLVASNVIEQKLPQEMLGKALTVTGYVTSIPEVKLNRTRFNFEVDEIFYQGRSLSGPEKLRLNWYGKKVNVTAGEKWRLDVKLKPARGLSNPGGFDYERWLFENRITATGYVISKGEQQMLAVPPWHSINAWRQKLRDKINAQKADSPHVSLINALLVGDRSQVVEQQWQVLTATGTNHLLAISGLHIGLIAGLVYWLLHRLFKKAGQVLNYVPAYKLAAIGAMIAATFYAALAGFSIPTQRALIMIAVALLLTVINRSFSSSRILMAAVFVVLLYDPLSVLSVSFWLSFSAVVIIVFAMQGRLETKSLWWQFGRLQWVISLAMIPVVLYAFQAFSVVSPLANIIAVPWVSFVVVPLVFLSAVFSWLTPVFDLLLQLADYSLMALWWVLDSFSNWPLARWFGNIPSLWVLSMSLLGAFFLIAPRGLPIRIPGIVLFVLIFFAPDETLDEGSFKLIQLDVGQGLSSVVQTQNHLLVYDTGASFGDSFNMGSSVITPFLRTLNARQIDTLLISHGDNDHIGGMNSLIKDFSVDQVLSGIMEKTPFKNAVECESKQAWVWDGVNFEILHPDIEGEYSDNNGSCVLKISNQRHSVLLTGDIEKKAEKTLLRNRRLDLDVNVMVAPHHGSKTSSTKDFIDAVSPEWILFPAGYLNRFGFPKQSVVERYIQQGSHVMVTGELGAITFTFAPDADATVTHHRKESSRIWN